MIFFINVLRVLAACLITNAHYTGIYPTDYIANGGLLGDGLFFVVSGYCLYNVKDSFAKWYSRRIYRVYPPVVIMTAIYMLLGYYTLEEHSMKWWFVYPTYYHFVASIIVLYIPFYIIMKNSWLKTHILQVMLVVLFACILIYFSFYDKSYYHIDNVREPMIRFLFMECMLLGAWFREQDFKYRNKFSIKYPIISVVLGIMYIGCKVFFSKIEILAYWQLLNQFVIFAFLVCIFRTFCSLDKKLEMLPSNIKKYITFLSKLTLEIYVVQYVLIDVLRSVSAFPLNWMILTSSIILAAVILHLLCKECDFLFVYVCGKLKNERVIEK